MVAGRKYLTKGHEGQSPHHFMCDKWNCAGREDMGVHCATVETLRRSVSTFVTNVVDIRLGFCYSGDAQNDQPIRKMVRQGRTTTVLTPKGRIGFRE